MREPTLEQCVFLIAKQDSFLKRGRPYYKPPTFQGDHYSHISTYRQIVVFTPDQQQADYLVVSFGLVLAWYINRWVINPTDFLDGNQKRHMAVIKKAMALVLA